MVFSLKHHLELLPALLGRVFSLSVDVHEFGEVDCMDIKIFLLISLILHRKGEVWGSPVRYVFFLRWHCFFLFFFNLFWEEFKFLCPKLYVCILTQFSF